METQWVPKSKKDTEVLTELAGRKKEWEEDKI